MFSFFFLSEIEEGLGFNLFGDFCVVYVICQLVALQDPLQRWLTHVAGRFESWLRPFVPILFGDSCWNSVSSRQVGYQMEIIIFTFVRLIWESVITSQSTWQRLCSRKGHCSYPPGQEWELMLGAWRGVCSGGRNPFKRPQTQTVIRMGLKHQNPDGTRKRCLLPLYLLTVLPAQFPVYCSPV